MEHEAWPSQQGPSREPLPRVEDLPLSDQGYEQESVKAAFDSFYRHAAQLDAALRTLEAVDSFHRQAAALRGDLRALRAAGWTQQTWTAPQTYGYGYGMRPPREGISPAVWRIGGEVAFLVAVAVALGVAKLSWWTILLAMAGALAIVFAIEWLAGREPQTFARAAEPAPVHPIVEAQRAEDTEEHEALGWTAFEEAQEPSDAMTIIGGEAAAEVPQPEPEPEPEPDLPPAAEQPVRAERGPEEGARANREVPPSQIEVSEGGELRVLSTDPWEQGFDVSAEESNEPDEETDESALAEQPGRRRFRRR